MSVVKLGVSSVQCFGHRPSLIFVRSDPVILYAFLRNLPTAIKGIKELKLAICDRYS
jgi:hypothetical protein